MSQERNVNDLQKSLENEFDENPDLYDPIDIERFRNDSWQVERYLTLPLNSKSTLEKIKETLRWRRDVRINEMKDEDFPREFYLINQLEILGTNPKDNTLLAWSCSKYTKEFAHTEEIKNYIKKFIVFEMNKLDQMAGRNGVTMVSDARNVTLSNVDVDMNRYNNEILCNHFPGLLRLSLVFNLSMLLGPIFRIIVSFMEEETRKKVKLIDKFDLPNFIDPKFIPIELGGEREENLVRVPEDAKNYKEILTELTPNQLVKFDSILSKMRIT